MKTEDLRHVFIVFYEIKTLLLRRKMLESGDESKRKNKRLTPARDTWEENVLVEWWNWYNKCRGHKSEVSIAPSTSKSPQQTQCSTFKNSIPLHDRDGHRSCKTITVDIDGWFWVHRYSSYLEICDVNVTYVVAYVNRWLFTCWQLSMIILNVTCQNKSYVSAIYYP